MRNIKLILEYDGTNYYGWQSQAGTDKPTIEDTLKGAIRQAISEDVSLHSSGRTDAGVHALGHVVNFKTSHPLPPKAWPPVLNRLLPSDIRVISSMEAPLNFDSRRSAKAKLYRYLILNRPEPTALYRKYAWHVGRPLDLGKMRLAAKRLMGRHDFKAFRSSDCGATSTVRTIRNIKIKRQLCFIGIDIEADAFLMHMARNIVGTLVEVGLGRFRPSDVSRILSSGDRAKAGITAPAHGLYLVRVDY